MRLSKITRGASVLALALAAGACDEGLTELNKNPNSPEDVTADFLLRQSLQTVVANAVGTGMSINHAGLWAQQVAQIQYADEDRYQPRADNIQSFWDTFYSGPLKDFEAIIQKAKAANDTKQEAVAVIMKSWTYGVMTDLWGDIPYSEAARGEEGAFTPKYDSQQEIYNSLFAELRRADQLLAAAGPAGTATGFGTADLIYGQGSASTTGEWRRFANSLRMRLAIHLTKVDPAKARSEFEAAVTTGMFFTSPADDAKLQYLSSAPNQNPYYTLTFVTGRDDHRVSTTMINQLQSTNDPRLPIYAQPAVTGGGYVGYGNGLPNNTVRLDQVSKIGAAFLSPNAPLYLMTHAEVEFIRAEAAARGWNAGGSAEALYRSGITSSMRMYGVPDAAIATYLAQPSVQYSAANFQRQISTQKWIALYMQGYEAWTEWRRTGFPVLTPGPAARAGGIPRRFPYPNLEISLNRVNLEAAQARQGNTGLQTGRVWWDK